MPEPIHRGLRIEFPRIAPSSQSADADERYAESMLKLLNY